MKKILTYIITLSFAASLVLSVSAAEEPADMLTDESDNNPIIVMPWSGYDSEDTTPEPTTEPQPADSDTTTEMLVDPFNPTDTTEPPPSDTLPVDTDPENPPDTSEGENTAPSDTSDTGTGDIVDDTTSDEPQISFDTTPETTEPTAPIETEPPATAATTAEPIIQPPVYTDPITVPQTEPVYESSSEATVTPEISTTTTEAVVPPTTITPPPDGGNEAEPVDGDPDSFITTIVLIGAAIAVFVLILIVPPIFRKIRKNIIYKYD